MGMSAYGHRGILANGTWSYGHMSIWYMVYGHMSKRNCTLTRRAGEFGGLPCFGKPEPDDQRICEREEKCDNEERAETEAIQIKGQ